MSDTAKPTASDRYGAVSIFFHWTIAALMVGMVFYGWWMEGVREAAFAGEASFSAASSAYNWHKTIGIAVLALSLARLGWRLGHPVPPLPAHMAAWEKGLARFTHVAFYVLMIGMPIGGYVAASSFTGNFPILLFDAVELPKLPVPQTSDFQELSGSLHGAGGWVILGVLALHVAGALKHHIVDRDGVLTRMIPGLDVPEQKNRP
ncbi:cytochrome b [Marinicauda algicola]|uniref:Cytochrome b n=1 Tax=Marinicauda algicola TaxID=2029849 RepID=A0A4S2GZD4_9PROT|nr:cytochrome b [Marinicauda algicola]TGY88474.1 cytochrome b [Marinicauda algicola]